MGIGNDVRLIDVDSVIYFQAADKYTGVFSSDGEFLIRTPIKELMEQLDPGKFWQIHRSGIVKISAITQASRDFSGKITLPLKQCPQKLAVSKPYAHLFRQMQYEFCQATIPCRHRLSYYRTARAAPSHLVALQNAYKWAIRADWSQHSKAVRITVFDSTL